MKIIAVFLFAALLIPVPALADCSDPQNQSEMNICAHDAYMAADKELNEVYGRAMAVMKEMDRYLEAGLKGAAITLRAAQRAWIVFRDKACEAYGFQARGGSMEPMLVGGCLARLTRERTKHLQELANDR